ncbi:cyclic nucleotide-binding/CBS domain-containing protein [Streptomyces sp. CoH27]|uniref:CBS domain-containing protein n=1 Tax=Streptomyces sp. CoH27 TaxID=2875763 RepID=UPI0021E5B5B1|nr:CBS domain-containing protein [Streptomyces sp. CoH27]
MTDAPTAVDARASVTAVAQVMRNRGIDLVMVVADGHLIGLVSGRDLLVGAVADGADPRRVPVARSVPGELVTVTVDEDIAHAAMRMRERSARYAAVTVAGEPVGLVCADDPALGATWAPTVAPTPELHGRVVPGA